MSEETKQEASKIFGQLVNNPEYLISLVWRNNPTGVQAALRAYGLNGDVHSEVDVLKSLNDYIKGDPVKGRLASKAIAAVGINPNKVSVAEMAALTMFQDSVRARS